MISIVGKIFHLVMIIEAFLISLIFLQSPAYCEFMYDDTFTEELLIKPLGSGEVYAQFKFVVEKEVHPLAFTHFRLFPRLLGEIISKNSVQELHFSLTQGLWRYEKWGYPYRDAPPGAEVWAWFQKGTADIDGNWRNLVNALSGQFCASLNFVDEKNTVEPKFSFRPQGAVPYDIAYNSTHSRYASLPAEIVCTENLTPFKKLLPCDTKAGISTLLNAINLFGAHYVSLAMDLRTICKNEGCSITAYELSQSVSVVFDPPAQQQGKQDWSLVKLFGLGLMNTCPVASKSMMYIDISLNKTGVPFVLKPPPPKVEIQHSDGESTEVALYDLQAEIRKSRPFNVVASYKNIHIYWIAPPPMLYAHRHVTGYGQERSGIRSVIYNNHPTQPVKVIYMDVIPWYLRLYLHTMTITSGDKTLEPEYTYYSPAKDQGKSSHIEILLIVPPSSKTEISMDFEYAFLKWTDYPPDANHGFSVGSAVISTLLPTSQNFTTFPGHIFRRQHKEYFLRMHTEVLLVSLPTPDFSMPYNVICLSCTVVALAFGPIHNITTKSLQPVPTDEVGLFTKLKNFFKKSKKSDDDTKKEDDSDKTKKKQ